MLAETGQATILSAPKSDRPTPEHMKSSANPTSTNASATNGFGTLYRTLALAVLSALLSGCAGLQQADLSPEARAQFLQGFHQVSYLERTERAKQILGPALQFPISYSKDRAVGMHYPRETVNSLYWLRSVPDDIVHVGELVIKGVAIVDPDYARTYAEKVPDEMKCKDDDESKIAFAKAYLAKRGGGSSITPKSQFKIYQSGLVIAKGRKPIGSSMVKVTFRLLPEYQDKIDKLIDSSDHTFVFEKIPGDREERVMLIGWVNGMTDFRRAG